MRSTVREAMSAVRENDVTFVRLTFCDLLGRQKDVTVSADVLAEAFSCGVAVEAGQIVGYEDLPGGRLLLRPDPATLCVLPWRPRQGKTAQAVCDLYTSDLTPCAFSGRRILREAVDELREFGVSVSASADCEFYLLNDVEGGLQPDDNGGYCDASPADCGENIRRDICLALSQREIPVRLCRHAEGPGQHAVELAFCDPLLLADRSVELRAAAGEAARQSGLKASFLPIPLPGLPGSSYTLSLRLMRGGENITDQLKSGTNGTISAFVAGMLHHATEWMLFANPAQPFGSWLSGFQVGWGENPGMLLRLSGEGERCALQLQSPDSSANPYLLLALLLRAGMNGVRQALTVESVQKDAKLPQSFAQAGELAVNSAFVHAALPEGLAQRYLQTCSIMPDRSAL